MKSSIYKDYETFHEESHYLNVAIPVHRVIQRSSRGLHSPEPDPRAALETIIDADPPGRIPAENHQKRPLELPPEDAVDDEVDRRVDGHQEIGHPHQLRQENVEVLDDIHQQREDVASQEDADHTQQHGGQSELAFLFPAEGPSLVVGAADCPPDVRVEDGQYQEGDEVHDQEVEPDVVHLVVELVEAEFGGDGSVHG